MWCKHLSRNQSLANEISIHGVEYQIQFAGLAIRSSETVTRSTSRSSSIALDILRSSKPIPRPGFERITGLLLFFIFSVYRWSLHLRHCSLELTFQDDLFQYYKLTQVSKIGMFQHRYLTIIETSWGPGVSQVLFQDGSIVSGRVLYC